MYIPDGADFYYLVIEINSYLQEICQNLSNWWSSKEISYWQNTFKSIKKFVCLFYLKIPFF